MREEKKINYMKIIWSIKLGPYTHLGEITVGGELKVWELFEYLKKVGRIH